MVLDSGFRPALQLARRGSRTENDQRSIVTRMIKTFPKLMAMPPGLYGGRRAAPIKNRTQSTRP